MTKDTHTRKKKQRPEKNNTDTRGKVLANTFRRQPWHHGGSVTHFSDFLVFEESGDELMDRLVQSTAIDAVVHGIW